MKPRESSSNEHYCRKIQRSLSDVLVAVTSVCIV